MNPELKTIEKIKGTALDIGEEEIEIEINTKVNGGDCFCEDLF